MLILPSSQKSAIVTLVIYGVTVPILIKFAEDVATILPLNIFESELPYSYPFQNASLRSERHLKTSEREMSYHAVFIFFYKQKIISSGGATICCKVDGKWIGMFRTAPCSSMLSKLVVFKTYMPRQTDEVVAWFFFAALYHAVNMHLIEVQVSPWSAVLYSTGCSRPVQQTLCSGETCDVCSKCFLSLKKSAFVRFYPRNAMLARV